MQLLLVWIGNLIASVIAFFAASLTKKAAFGAAAVAAVIALTVVMAASIQALLTGIVYTLPEWASTGASMLPSNLAACISAIISAKLIRYFYDLKTSQIKLVASVN